MLLTWSAPEALPDRAPVTGYVVYLELPAGGFQRLGVTRSLSYIHAEQLAPGERYVFSVRASSVAGLSDTSASAFVDVPPMLAPNPPGNLVAELTPDREVLLTWSAPVASPDRVPVTGYVVYLELPAGGFQRLGVSESLSYTHAEQLAPGERYVFSVRASSVAGLSDTSASAFVDVPPMLAPNPPGNLVAELTPDREVLLTWSAPVASLDRVPVTGYVVYLELPAGGFQRLGVSESLSYTHAEQLAPGERYVFWVRASSDAGLSHASASASVDVPRGPVLAPNPPGNLVAELTPDREVLLTWSAPVASPDRVPVTGYVVYLELPAGDFERLGVTESLSYIHDEQLSPGERYVFSVRASSDAGQSNASASAFVDVPPTVVLLSPEPPGNFTAELTPTNEALLQWTPPTPAPERAPVTGYVVYVDSLGSPLRPLPETDASSYLQTGLLQGASYVFHVVAQSASGPSQPSASASVNVAIGALVRLVAPHVTVRADEGVDKAVISWVHSPQSPDAGVPTAVSEFSLQYCVVDIDEQTSDHCSEGWQEFEDISLNTPAARQVVDTAIDCDSTNGVGMGARMYRMRAVADNDSLSSRYSDPTPPVCPSATYSPPRRVTAVFATESSTQRVNVCWNVPESNEDAVAGYELQIAPDAEIPSTEDGWLTVDARIPTATQPVCVLYTGVVANQSYWFRVRAYNRAGHGNWSAPYQYSHGLEFVPGTARRASVQSPNTFTVTNARAREGTDATLAFEVTLDRPASGSVTVDYATADGTATAGEDYDAVSGTLALAAGETSKTIEVTVHADTENEGEETLTLSLTNAVGARIEDGEATGTIQDKDPLPKAWLARFGRTVAGQVVDAVGTRLESEPSPHARVGGMSIGSSSSSETRRTLSRGAAAEPASNAWDRPEDTRSLSRRALMSGSSFHLASEGAGPVFAAWGRFATEGFEADVHDTRLDGDTTTGFLGADVTGGRWLMGAAVSHSEADGSFVPRSGAASPRNRSDVESTLSGVYPYARLTLSERVSLWGLAGVGHGTLTVSEAGRTPVDTDIGMNMGALGARGTMLSPSEAGGIELALRSDAFWVRMTSDEARSETAGDLADIRTDASRVRLFLEAEREFAVRGEGTLTPSFEVGVRHDGGDAETGTGFEAGAGMRYAAEGIAIEGTVRKLVTHEDSGYEEWGASGSVRIDPGASGRGVSLTLAPAFGAASSETERLWSLGDARRLSGDTGVDAGSRLEAEVGYGWRLLSTTHGMLTPYTGLSFSETGSRAWRLGARLMVTRDISFGLEGTHRERSDVASDQAVILHGRLHW